METVITRCAISPPACVALAGSVDPAWKGCMLAGQLDDLMRRIGRVCRSGVETTAGWLGCRPTRMVALAGPAGPAWKRERVTGGANVEAESHWPAQQGRRGNLRIWSQVAELDAGCIGLHPGEAWKLRGALRRAASALMSYWSVLRVRHENVGLIFTNPIRRPIALTVLSGGLKSRSHRRQLMGLRFDCIGRIH